jgi:hypothetical protein
VLLEIEGKKKNFGKKYDINVLKKNIVENYSKILVDARKVFAVESVKPDLKLTLRQCEAGKSTRVSQRNLVLPTNNIFDFGNQLIGVEWNTNNQFKFVMSSGEKSDIQW